MEEVIKAIFKIGNNNKVSGVMSGKTESKKFSCWSSESFHIDGHSAIYGKTNKNQHISLLDCLSNESAHHTYGESSYSCEVYSHTIVMGNEKIVPQDDKFSSISLTVGNPLKLFRHLDSFGYVNLPDRKLVDALNKQEGTPQFDIEKHPIVAYFNGDFNIFKQDTKLGIIKADNSVKTGFFGGAFGVKIENEITITINFHKAVSIDEAFKRANLISLFLRFVGGKGLFFKDILLRKAGHECSEFTIIHHDNYDWGSELEDDYYSDPLMDVTSDNFLTILKNWFDKDDRENVRHSFYNTYFRDVYSPNRLITAANMFDIFPISDDDKNKSLSSGAKSLLQALRVHIKSEFSEFSDIKQSLCQSISHLTRQSLKDKVLKRIKIIKPYLVDCQFDIKDLEFIVNIAIKSRNYYVHGSEYKRLSPEKLSKYQILFINTFEYIYGMSELIECGWSSKDAQAWTSRHKIKTYKYQANYQILELREAIET